MIEPITIQELIRQLLTELETRQYAPNTQDGYRRYYHRLRHYAEKRAIREYSPAIGRDFFETTYQCPLSEIPRPVPRRLRGPLRYLTTLDHYYQQGTLLRRWTKAPRALPEPLDQVLTAFASHCDQQGYSRRTARKRHDRIRMFLTYVASQGIALADLNGRIVSGYTATLTTYQPRTKGLMLSGLRTFLRFVHRAGYHRMDLSPTVAPLRIGRKTHLPQSWPADVVPRLLAAVDRGTPMGKRDYAMLLLAIRLGLRIGDITALPLTALHWPTKTLCWIQTKTGRAMEQPLLDDVGWAIIDYLQHGRPQTTQPVIFVRHRAPFEPFDPGSNLHGLLMRYARLAGLDIPSGSHGMHALRHLLASTLLSHETPLPIISQVLGHHSTASTHVYLHVDIVGLRRCALNPEEVHVHVES